MFENTLLKLFMGANKWFSMDDSAMHFNFEGHLLLIDKDIKIPVVLSIFKEGLGCSSADPVVILLKSMDW